MTAALEAAPAVASGFLLALAAWLAGMLAWASRGTDEPQWQPGGLAAFAAPQTGRHRAVGARIGDQLADDHAYTPRHGWDEVPPSIGVPLALMAPAERARELTRQLGNWCYSPWRGLADRQLRIRLTAATVARRNGVPMLLGTMHRTVALP
jgi:hypothetical protein